MSSSRRRSSPARPARRTAGGGDGDGDELRTEYRIDELAREAGTTVRNVRSYQDRGLLPPPRRSGRVGLYSGSHLARLRIIGDLLERGYTLANIAELVAGWERGQDLSELLGLENALIGPWADGDAATVDPETLAAALGEGFAPDVMAEAERLGLISPDPGGGGYRVTNPRMLEAASILMGNGVPAADVLATGYQVAVAMDRVARDFVDMVNTHVFEPVHLPAPAGEVRRLADMVRQLRPLARAVVDAELDRSLDHWIRAEMGERLARIGHPVDEEAAS